MLDLKKHDAEAVCLDPAKFRDPRITAKGEERAVVALTQLKTLWFNTGSLCNITCKNCYMDSSPKNDSLAYLSLNDVCRYLDEIGHQSYPVSEIAFTGGEPFMNRDLLDMLGESLGRGYRALVLTNAMKPLLIKRRHLVDIQLRHGHALMLRVSIDGHEPKKHETIRGAETWRPMITGLRWLAENGFNLAIAGRTCWGETEEMTRQGYAAMFAAEGIDIDACDPDRLLLFPEMNALLDVPEITVNCWDILGIKPETIMCATSRMVAKRKGADSPVVVPCTLLPYDTAFELGADLANSAASVSLNHPHCAKFCVLGGASCSTN